MAVLRQSFIALGYVVILMPHIESASEVLDQRNRHQNKKKVELEIEIDYLKGLVKNLEKLQEKINSVNIQDEFASDQSSQLSAEDDIFHPEDLKIFKKELAEKQS
jgi:hypothetical protein